TLVYVVRGVRVDRPFRERESLGNLLFARAGGDPAADLALALSQPAKSGFVFHRARRMQGRQLVDELEHDLSPDPNLSLPDEPDRFEDEAGIGVPRAIPVRTILQRPDGGQVAVGVRQHDRPGRRTERADRLETLKPVDPLR